MTDRKLKGAFEHWLCEHSKTLVIMSRNILELKSIKIAPEKVQTLAAAKRLAKLKDFDLKEEFVYSSPTMV